MTALPHEVLMASGYLGRVDAILRRLPVGPVVGAEVGVFCGLMSSHLLKARPDLTLYMVDSWAPARDQPEPYRATRDSHAHMTAAEQDENALVAEQSTAFAQGRRHIVRSTSLDAARAIAGLDFVFLDADHSYEGVRADIDAWRHAIKPGGWLAGHDYDEAYGPDAQYDFGVIAAVDDEVRAHGWTLERDIDSTWFVRV